MDIDMNDQRSTFSGQCTAIRCRGRSGQAIAELVVGLIALLVVFMGMLQIQYLARAHTRVLIDARAQAGQNALANIKPPPSALLWISDWQAGSDNIRYSRDDLAVENNNNRMAVSSRIVAPAFPSMLQIYAPANALSTAATPDGLVNELPLWHGLGSRVVGIFPLIHTLVYGVDSIQVQGDAWLTWTHIE
jgi:hypothetical protein